MKKISDYFKDDLGVSEIKKEVLSNSLVNKVITSNNIPDKEVERKLTDLYRFTNEVLGCKGCKGIEFCTMNTIGFYPKLESVNKKIYVRYVQCDYHKEAYKEAKKKNRLVSMYMPSSDYEDFEPTEERKAVMYYISDFIQSDSFMRGMFLHGKPGIGKTRILSVTAKKLSKNREVLYINYPDFVREIKSSINDGTLENKVELLKNTELLILDDFGDEGIQSDWFRDEVLMPILQTRMAEKKPVFFGSNFSLSHLEDNLIRKVKDEVKVERLMERIRVLSKPFELKGKNYRE